MNIRAIFAAAFAVTASAGCYGYVPVAPAVPEPGAFVRADVGDAAAPILLPVLGPGVIQVHGMVLRHENEALSLLVDAYATVQNGNLFAMNEPVLLPYPAIRTLTVKRFSPGRSALFGVAFVAGGYLTITVFTDLGRRFTGEDGDGNPQPELRSRKGFTVPIGVRIPIPGRHP